MLPTDNLDPLEKQRAEMWELFAELMSLDPKHKFTAKELSHELEYSKSELNKLLFRLSLNKALILHSRQPGETSKYSLNKAFLSK